eukprot:655562-Amphidinium_carterae.1
MDEFVRIAFVELAVEVIVATMFTIILIMSYTCSIGMVVIACPHNSVMEALQLLPMRTSRVLRCKVFVVSSTQVAYEEVLRFFNGCAIPHPHPCRGVDCLALYKLWFAWNKRCGVESILSCLPFFVPHIYTTLTEHPWCPFAGFGSVHTAIGILPLRVGLTPYAKGVGETGGIAISALLGLRA